MTEIHIPDVCQTCQGEVSCRPADHCFASDKTGDCPLYVPTAQTEVTQ